MTNRSFFYVCKRTRERERKWERMKCMYAFDLCIHHHVSSYFSLLPLTCWLSFSQPGNGRAWNGRPQRRTMHKHEWLCVLVCICMSARACVWICVSKARNVHIRNNALSKHTNGTSNHSQYTIKNNIERNQPKIIQQRKCEIKLIKLESNVKAWIFSMQTCIARRQRNNRHCCRRRRHHHHHHL